jgi:hypothetical protein
MSDLALTELLNMIVLRLTTLRGEVRAIAKIVGGDNLLESVEKANIMVSKENLTPFNDTQIKKMFKQLFAEFVDEYK